jgi:prophage antirepressor-like protein
MSDERPPESEGKMVVFGARQIRRIWHMEQWYFSIVDIVGALTDSANPRNYWNMLKARERKQSKTELSTYCVQLKLTSSDGKTYKTDCVNTEAAFRIIQSIPSPRAEPFKRWLAEVGYQRVQEIENPELAQQRMRALYQEKGYPDDWIERRVRGVAVRDELTSEWQKRGVTEQRDFAILTAQISKATFGLTPTDYKNLKGLNRENLRDHMTDLELIFTKDTNSGALHDKWTNVYFRRVEYDTIHSMAETTRPFTTPPMVLRCTRWRREALATAMDEP